MKITGRVEIEKVIEVLCDACSSSTRSENGGLQYASLHAHWGYGTRHDGEVRMITTFQIDSRA